MSIRFGVPTHKSFPVQLCTARIKAGGQCAVETYSVCDQCGARICPRHNDSHVCPKPAAIS